MTAPGTIRAAVEERIIAKAGQLAGFATEPLNDDLWWVTGPLNSEPQNRRIVIIGAATGDLNPEGMQAGHGPQTDQWSITCVAIDTLEQESAKSKAAVEQAVNRIADMLAADDRLTLPGAPVLGCHGLALASMDGPDFWWEPGQAPLGRCEFTITASAPIHRNPT